MARKTTKPPEAPPPAAALTMSRAEAEAKLNARIEKGNTLAGRFSREPAGDVEAEYDQWESYNVEMLRRMFTDSSFAAEYANAGPPGVVLDLGGGIDYGRELEIIGHVPTSKKLLELPHKLSALASIRERLELVEEPAQTRAPAASAERVTAGATRRAAFIVHGHDEGAREATARVLQQLDVEPIILHEQTNQGRTILEKIEAHANDVPFAVILLTPDDVGGTSAGDLKPRARQNVILELGFFWGKLSRSQVCVLYKEGVELPSDLGGLVYVKMDDGRAWRFKLAEELNAAGVPVDLNRLLRGS